MTECIPNSALVDAHLHTLPGGTQAHIRASVQELIGNRSRGSKYIHPEEMALVPVAAHEDGPKVEHALNLYADQQDAPDFEVALSLNWPARASVVAVRQTVEIVRDFQHDNPDLPLTFFTMAYPPGTPIGRLRRDLWVGSLAYRYSSEGNPARAHEDRDVALVNHDIDPEWLSPRYLRRKLEVMRQPGIRAVRSPIQYARDPARPNMNGLFAWQELPIKLELMYSEANAAVSMRNTYLAANGFSPDAQYGELVDVIKRVPGYKTGDGSMGMAHDNLLISDSRRMVAATLDPDNPIPPWQIDYATTCSSQAYRNQPLPQGDISAEQYSAWVDDYYYEYFFPNAPRIALPRNGLDWTLNLVNVVDEARKTIGGPELDKERARVLMQATLDKMNS